MRSRDAIAPATTTVAVTSRSNGASSGPGAFSTAGSPVAPDGGTGGARPGGGAGGTGRAGGRGAGGGRAAAVRVGSNLKIRNRCRPTISSPTEKVLTHVTK